ncbi:FG-GAP-like repeat-containing protein, partial [Nocardioides hankookensis]
MTPLRPVLLAAIVTAGIAAIPAALVVLPADASGDATETPTFRRIDIDTGILGASFTSVGQVLGTEQDIVTSGYGELDDNGRPVGGGTLQLYRPGARLNTWTKVPVFGAGAGIVFPNATTIDDVDGDGDNDIIVPSGYFFGTDASAPTWLNTTGAITWWENKGAGTPFTKHVVVEGQAGSYHGVQHVDLDGDGTLDLVAVSEEAKQAGNQVDDEVRTQFFQGLGGGAFAAPVELAVNLGGSQPVVYDVDGDDDLDIVSSQYFHLLNSMSTSASFLWLENTDTDGVLAAADFTPHTIAKLTDVGMGFQIRPVPGFHGPGTVSWIGTNHVNRCTFALLNASFAWPEQVIEFTPGDDLAAPWARTTLSDPATPPEACPSDYGTNRDDYPEFSNAITSRYGPGQGAPGVLGYGDVDGDGDVDLAVSGDGDRRLWWIENLGDGETALHRLTDQGEYFGQAGGAVVADLNGREGNELVFSSFDQDTLAIWTRDTETTPSPTPTPSTSPTTTPVTTVRSTLRVGPARQAVRAGRKATWSVRLRGADGGARRTVVVVFDPARGRQVRLGTITLRRAAAGVQQGKVVDRPTVAGR